MASMTMRRQPLFVPSVLLLGTSVTFKPFLSKAVILVPVYDGWLFAGGIVVVGSVAVAVLLVKSSNKLLLRILPVIGDTGDSAVVGGSIDKIVLPFVEFK